MKLWTVIFGVALGVASTSGCRRIAIENDFRAPYEREGILMPHATSSFMLAGPPGVTVDIGIDFEESEHHTDRLKLTVGTGRQRRLGAEVPGSQIRRAVCGVTLTEGGVPVDVKNLNTLRSAPFSLRVERTPSHICQPKRVVPSSALALR